MDRPDALRVWLERISGPEWIWFAKRLSANDTGLTGGHQVGFYLPRDVALAIAPDLDDDVLNPRHDVTLTLVSHDQRSNPSLIYYNSRVARQQPNGRNEFRLTGFGGRRSALQDADSTGGILVTAWDPSADIAVAWLATTADEEDVIEAAIGPVDPGTQVQRLHGHDHLAGPTSTLPATCEPDITELPAAWVEAFPPGRELTDEAIRRRPGGGDGVDRRLVDRYRCEFGLFRVVETAHTLPRIEAGFPTVDAFLTVAQTVANRRKSRAGRSLELHLAQAFGEEGIAYDAGKQTEGNRTPDFVFPSIEAYHDGRPTRMLGVKTSVKERWRQVLDEAALIPEKHLFTLSEGVSPDQFAQMDGSNLRLVVPADNVPKFPAEIRPRLLTLAQFVELVR